MESITLFNVVFLPHTWPLVFGVPAFIIATFTVAGLYEIITNLNNGE